MVTVKSLPTVQQALPGANYSTVQASPNAMGAGVARSLQGTGAALEDAGLKIKAEDDTRAVMNAEMALGGWEQNNLNDPEKGYFSKQGNNAIGGSAKIAEGYQKEYGTIRAQMGNEQQRAAFDKIYAARRESTMERVTRHEATQRQSAMVDTQNAMMKQALENAMSNYTDPNTIASNINQGLRAIGAVGSLNGDSKIVMTEKARGFTSTVHRGVISRMMDDNPAAAQAYLKANEKQMVSSDIEAVEGPLKNQNTKYQAKGLSEQIFAEGGGAAVMYAKAREIEDPEVSDSVLGRIKVMQAEEKQIQVDKANDAWGALSENPSFDAIPAEVNGKEKIAMQNYVEKRNSGTPIKTDMTYYEQLSNLTPAQLKETELDFTRLSEKHATYFMNQRRKSTTGAGTYGQEDIISVSNDLLAAAGITNDRDKGAFKARFREEFDQASANKGTKLTYEEVQKIGDRLLMKTKGTGWFADETPNYKRIVEGVPNTAVDDIAMAVAQVGLNPDDEELVKSVYKSIKTDRQEIIDALVASGKPVTYDTILRAAVNTEMAERKSK